MCLVVVDVGMIELGAFVHLLDLLGVGAAGNAQPAAVKDSGFNVCLGGHSMGWCATRRRIIREHDAGLMLLELIRQVVVVVLVCGTLDA